MVDNTDDGKGSKQAFLDRGEASAHHAAEHHVRIAPATLAAYAVNGTGPPFMRSGRQVLYKICDLDAWARSRMSGPFSATCGAGE
jgi:hypothetical protein